MGPALIRHGNREIVRGGLAASAICGHLVPPPYFPTSASAARRATSGHLSVRQSRQGNDPCHGTVAAGAISEHGPPHPIRRWFEFAGDPPVTDDSHRCQESHGFLFGRIDGRPGFLSLHLPAAVGAGVGAVSGAARSGARIRRLRWQRQWA